MSSYRPLVRVGNWVEDQAASAEAASAALSGAASGTSLSRLVAAARERLPLTQPADGLVRFGDVLSLEGGGGGLLAACCDAAQPDPHGCADDSASCPVALAPQAGGAAARCAFVLESVAPRSVDDIALSRAQCAPPGGLYYGCKFRLRLALAQGSSLSALLPPRLRAHPLRLASAPLTSSRFAPKSKRQLVFLLASRTGEEADALWTVLPGPGGGGPADAARLEGQPVRYGQPVVLQHAPTARALSWEEPTFPTAWAAAEGEVAAWTHAPPGAGRTASLEHVNAGKTEAEISNRRVAERNVWRFSCA